MKLLIDSFGAYLTSKQKEKQTYLQRDKEIGEGKKKETHTHTDTRQRMIKRDGIKTVRKGNAQKSQENRNRVAKRYMYKKRIQRKPRNKKKGSIKELGGLEDIIWRKKRESEFNKIDGQEKKNVLEQKTLEKTV